MMNLLKRFATDRSGAVIVYIAVMAPVLAGLAGLAVDTGMWYAQSRHIQAASDSAATAGALEILRSDSDATAVAATVQADLAVYGYSSADGDSITINYPPVSGAYIGAMDKVEVIVGRPAFRTLSAVFLEQEPNVSARAVGFADINDTCVWSLNPTAPNAVSVSGTANVTLGCGVFVNSNDPGALTESGSGCLTATKIKTVGGSSGDCLNPGPLANASPIADPLASVQAPPYTPGVCDFPGNITVNGSETLTLTPGTYCGTIKAVSTATLNFDPGLYIFENGGSLDIGAQATVTGIDVSFYFTPTGTGAININGGASVTLKAPPDGPLPGILFYHDRDSTTTVTHKITGGANMILEGIIYFPSHDLQFAGGSDLNTTSTMIVANTVSFTGNTNVGGLAGTASAANPLLITATLVE